MRAPRRRRGARLLAGLVLGLAVTGVALAHRVGHGGPASPVHAIRGSSASAMGPTGPASTGSKRFAVGLRVLTLVEPGRRIRLPHGRSAPRTLVTYVRYPALGSATGTEHRNALPDRADGPFPLIVFGHGFRLTPGPYRRLLAAWARAGYVVAAPVFPLQNAHAPGGPREADIVNQPHDMSFVISKLLAASASASDPLAGTIDGRRIAVAGHSDGGETALAVAYDPGYRDRRVGAAVILSGAKLPGSGLRFPRPSPALLAAQGSADTTNLPRNTRAFYGRAPRPKYLLTLLGAGHLPPYTRDGPQVRVVERVSIAFLERYLAHRRIPAHRIASLGRVPGVSRVDASP